MNKLVFFALAGFSCFLLAEGNDKFAEEWEKYMNENYCDSEASEEVKKKFIDCSNLLTVKCKDILKEQTGESTMEGSMNKLCVDEDTKKKVCKEMKEKKVELGIDEAKIEEMRKCKNE